MHYKTIILELLEQQPTLHTRLKAQRKLLTALDFLSHEFKSRHETWHRTLRTQHPDIDPGCTTGAAMECALREMEQVLQNSWPEIDQEPLSLDVAVAFVRNLTSSG